MQLTEAKNTGYHLTENKNYCDGILPKASNDVIRILSSMRTLLRATVLSFLLNTFRHLLFLGVTLTPTRTVAQAPKPGSAGIHFIPGSIEKAQEAAGAAGKPLFVEIHLTGCPHCEALAPVLQEPSVGKFYNQEFISWRAEANSADSKAFQKLKGVTYPEFPLLFFFAPTGELIHMATPREQQNRQDYIDEILKIGATAQNPQERTGGYAARLASGDHDVMFLISYGKYAKAMKDPGKLAQINDLLARALSTPADAEGQVGFYVLQRLTDNYENPLATYFFSHLGAYKAKYPAKHVQEAGEAILYHTLYGSKGDTYSTEQLRQMRKSMMALGLGEAEASARMLIKELDAYLRSNDTPGAVKHFEQYRMISKSLSLPDYAYLMKYFNEKATDHSYLSQMPVWAKEALRLAKPNDLKTKPAAGLFYELAESYRRSGQIAEARTNARKSLEIARASGEELKRYQALSDLIESPTESKPSR